MPKWLKEAVFYEIYPQSFKDSNGDGIGDIGGIIEKLDYVKSLGCNALWLNPLFDSPFKDAGYDVRDYKKVAPRYGTNEDLEALFAAAHDKGIHVLLDLVPGHTSEEHAWFLESTKPEKNDYSARYIWTDQVWTGIANHPYIAGDYARDGSYMLNFFKCQPALNYGWKTRTESWQSSPDSPEAQATRDAMKDVCLFWLQKGCDGFRVDMADSLVKEDDENKSETAKAWRDILQAVREKFPEAAFVSEWSNPAQALCGAGFDMDFYLDHRGNGYNTLVRDHETPGGNHSFFKKDAGGDIGRFLADYLPKYEASKDAGYISFLTCNHDTPRASFTLSVREMMLADAFYLTMPGVPFIYYGDEIGMRYIADQPTKEGGYQRTGTRTPMQWDHTKNLGFSAAKESDIYLPVDPAEDAPTVEDGEKDETSLLHCIRSLTALRAGIEDLQADGSFAVYEKTGDLGSEAFAYRRGDILLAVNPSGEEKELVLDRNRELIYLIGEAKIKEGRITIGAQSFVVLQ